MRCQIGAGFFACANCDEHPPAAVGLSGNDVGGELVTICADRICRERGAICHVMNPG